MKLLVSVYVGSIQQIFTSLVHLISNVIYISFQNRNLRKKNETCSRKDEYIVRI